LRIVIQQKPDSILIVDPNLVFIAPLQLFVSQRFPVSERTLVRGGIYEDQFFATRFDHSYGQAQLVGSVCPYEREALIAELDLHTTEIWRIYGKVSTP